MQMTIFFKDHENILKTYKFLDQILMPHLPKS